MHTFLLWQNQQCREVLLFCWNFYKMKNGQKSVCFSKNCHSASYTCQLQELKYSKSPFFFSIQRRLQQNHIRSTHSVECRWSPNVEMKFCFRPRWMKVCVEGSHCECRPGEARSIVNGKVRTRPKCAFCLFDWSRMGSQPLRYSSQFYSNQKTYLSSSWPTNSKQEMKQLVLRRLCMRKKYVTTDITTITHPKLVNSTWAEGLLVNFTVATKLAEWVFFGKGCFFVSILSFFLDRIVFLNAKLTKNFNLAVSIPKNMGIENEK